MIEFHNTRIGRQFIDGTIPKLVDTLERIAKALEFQMKLNEEFREAVEVNKEQMGTDPLLDKEGEFEREYLNIDAWIVKHMEGDYAQSEAASMVLSDCVIHLLEELKERRGG